MMIRKVAWTAVLPLTMLVGYSAFAQAKQEKHDIAGISTFMSYADAKAVLAKAGYTPDFCKDYGMSTGYTVRKTAAFSQILQQARGVKVKFANYQGVREACFKNSANREHVSIRFAQYPSGDKSYYVHYENRDRLLSRKAFEQRVRQKYGVPDPKRGIISPTYDFRYGKRNGEELIVWLGKKTIMLRHSWISRQAERQISDAKKKIQEEIDAKGTAKSSF